MQPREAGKNRWTISGEGKRGFPLDVEFKAAWPSETAAPDGEPGDRAPLSPEDRGLLKAIFAAGSAD